eukprot:GHVL01006782.1.p1 GENE.GHVL01006782.1~~GHVL01006782.1.p1  ORF type:complete len:239 (-),score=34.47 GHVL01006782.1:108-824(-)
MILLIFFINYQIFNKNTKLNLTRNPKILEEFILESSVERQLLKDVQDTNKQEIQEKHGKSLSRLGVKADQLFDVHPEERVAYILQRARLKNIILRDVLHLYNFKAQWVINDFSGKRRWHFREMKSGPLRTSYFNLNGIGGFQLRFWPYGNDSAKPGYASLLLNRVQKVEKFRNSFHLSIGDVLKGPFIYHTPEYLDGCRNFCLSDEIPTEIDSEIGVRMCKIKIQLETLSFDEALQIL